MRFHVLTLFPEAFGLSSQFSIVARAVQRGTGRYRRSPTSATTPMTPMAPPTTTSSAAAHGMVMKPEPVFEATEAALSSYSNEERASKFPSSCSRRRASC